MSGLISASGMLLPRISLMTSPLWQLMLGSLISVSQVRLFFKQENHLPILKRRVSLTGFFTRIPLQETTAELQHIIV